MLVISCVFVVLALGSLVRTTTGFGFSLVAVPPLALLADPVTAVVVAGLMSAPVSVWITARDRQHVDRRLAALFLGFGLAGVPFGVWLLAVLPERALMVAIAVMVLVGTFLVWRRTPIPGGTPTLAGVSALSGASFASTGIDGPLMVAALQGSGLEPRVQRATLSVMFSATSAASLAGFWTSGRLTPEVGSLLLVGVPAMLVGMAVGERVFRRLDAELFRRAVLWLLLISSVSVVTRVVTS
ncbi:sulfite exporter TauE/SafE family protein [Nocardiopsis sp. NPDC055824]